MSQTFMSFSGFYKRSDIFKLVKAVKIFCPSVYMYKLKYSLDSWMRREHKIRIMTQVSCYVRHVCKRCTILVHCFHEFFGRPRVCFPSLNSSFSVICTGRFSSRCFLTSTRKPSDLDHCYRYYVGILIDCIAFDTGSRWFPSDNRPEHFFLKKTSCLSSSLVVFQDCEP